MTPATPIRFYPLTITKVNLYPAIKFEFYIPASPTIVSQFNLLINFMEFYSFILYLFLELIME